MSRLSLDRVLTNHFGQNGSGLSPRVWSRIRTKGTGADGANGFFIADDFLLFGQSVAVSGTEACYVSQAGQYKTWEDTGSTVSQLATVAGGAIALVTDTTDNDQTSITQGGAGTAAATSVLGALSYDTTADRKMTVFEARWKVASVADDVSAVFVGLADDDIAAADSFLVDDTGAMVDDDFIGFHTVHENGGATNANSILRFSYKKNGQTVQVPITSLATLAADTYIKTAFVYDPSEPASRQITVYADNEPSSTYVTATNMDAATFPDGVMMAFAAAVKNGSAAASTLTLDWWAFYQEA
jgi:hypothetical protein